MSGHPWPSGGDAYERVCQIMAEHGSRWQSSHDWLCPAHDDHSASLGISEGDDGQVLVYCQAGCDTQEVLDKVELAYQDLFPVTYEHIPKMLRVAAYVFHDIGGTPVHRELREECRQFGSDPCPSHRKQFKQQAYEGGPEASDSSWSNSLKAVERWPYRAQQLFEDSPGRTVLVVEGPKDAERLLDDYGDRADFVVTSAAEGAGKWDSAWCGYFPDAADVVIIPDLDGAGIRHALKVASSVISELPGMPVSFALPDESAIRRARPGEPLKGLDYSDHANASGGVESLIQADEDALRSMLAAWGEETTDTAELADTTEEVARAVAKLRVQDEARRLYRAERDAADLNPPRSRFTLADELAIEEEALPFTISELHPTGANTLLTAQFKTGKTTIAMELYRSLIDGEPFLGAYDVAALAGRVAYWNFELSERQWRDWARRLDVRKADRAAVEHLRGHRLPLASPAGEAYAVEWLRSRQVAFWIVDPFGAAFDGDENSNSEVREWLRAIDNIKRLAGVADLVLVSHTGRGEQVVGQERSRGATKLDDWADVRWLYTQESGQRFLRAHGRDVDVREVSVDFDADSGRLSMGGVGDRRGLREERHVQKVAEVVAEQPGIGANDLAEAITGPKAERSSYIKAAVNRGLIEVRTEGKKNAHYPVTKVRAVADPSQEIQL